MRLVIWMILPMDIPKANLLILTVVYHLQKSLLCVNELMGYIGLLILNVQVVTSRNYFFLPSQSVKKDVVLLGFNWNAENATIFESKSKNPFSCPHTNKVPKIC